MDQDYMPCPTHMAYKDQLAPKFWWLNPWLHVLRLRDRVDAIQSDLDFTKRLLGNANDIADRWEARARKAEQDLICLELKRKKPIRKPIYRTKGGSK